MKKLLSIALALLMLVSLLLLSSCLGGEKAEITESISTAPHYEPVCILTYIAGWETTYPIEEEKIDYGGYEFKILNSSEINDMYIYLDPDMTGDILEDCCFERNLIAENKFGIRISEETKPYDKLAWYARTIILADEDFYDAMYLPINQLTPLISENLFHDLLSIEELHIENIWWDQGTIIKNILDDRLFFSTSDLHPMAFERSKCVYMNTDILASEGVDAPIYEVLDGEWTFDLMKKYCLACSNINGDDSFDFDIKGAAVYGISANDDAISLMAYSMGAEPVGRDLDGKYEFTADTDSKFKHTLNQLAELWNKNDGNAIVLNSENNGMDHIGLYVGGRSLFIIDELRNSPMINEKVSSSLILPLPKYDIEQERYEVPYSSDCLAFCIPSTNNELERTGVIVDYLTYESYAEFMPRYYSTRINEKRHIESDNIDILELMRGCRSIGAADAYGWLGDFKEQLVAENISEFDSVIYEYKDRITSAIEKTYSEYSPLIDG